jgi:hypothetical protein
MKLTPAEQAELNQLETEFSKPKGLSEAEKLELVQLEAEFGQPQNPFTFARDAVESGAAQPKKGNLTAGLINQAKQSATFGLGDEISAGFLAAPQYLGRQVGRGINAAGEGLGYEMNSADYQSPADIYNNNLQGERTTLQYAQQESPAATLAANLAGALTTGGLSAGSKGATYITNSLRSGSLPTRIAKGALLGEATNDLYNFGAGEGDASSRLGNVEANLGYGGAFGAALPVAGAAIKGVSQAIKPNVAPEVAELASRARELDIPLSVSQVAPSRFRKTLQKVSQEVPFSGVDDFEQSARKKYSQALAKTLGQQSEDLSPNTIQAFRTANSVKFDTALNGQTFKFTPANKESIKQVIDSASEALSADLQPTVAKNVKIALDTIQDGQISGEKLASLRSRLLKNATTSRNQASSYISDIISQIDDVIEGGISKDKLELLQSAKREYRNFRTLKPLLEKSVDGTVDPTQVLNRVAANRYIDASKIPVGQDDLVDLARIGKQFLPKLGGSDTMQKIGLTGAVIGGAVNPASIALTAGGMGANRLYQKAYNQNQKLVDALLKKTESGNLKLDRMAQKLLEKGSK